jgi:NADH:ubiquinone oxidoreductase subunit 5 (subunit L)/multisubunit Na+/H+ antiporter MnhA subunit
VATAFFAATVAIVQTDIKKVLAYSTVSQLGLMFLALGVGAYGVAIFHVVTHAFFEACLFLGAGSVIHALGVIWDEADELVKLADLSDPRVVIDTAGLEPAATLLANRLARDIRELDAETLARLGAVLDTAPRAP